MLTANGMHGRGLFFWGNGLAGCEERGNFRGLKTESAMTLVIELKDELEEKVEKVARQRGTTVSDLVAGYLESVVLETERTSPKPKSRVDELLELIGDVQGLPDQDDKREYYEAMARKHA